jgi:hypothetical protein
MSAASSSDRVVVVTWAVAIAFGLVLLAASWYARTSLAGEQVTQSKVDKSTPDGSEVRPFRVNVPERDLAELRRHIAATRWPEKETVADQSRGVPLATMGELANYWGTGYDWRRVEAKLNSLPQFMTDIDGLELHFIHVLALTFTEVNYARIMGSRPQYQAPRSWTERAYPKRIYYHRAEKGGHFAAWEQPMISTEELRPAFRSLR